MFNKKNAWLLLGNSSAAKDDDADKLGISVHTGCPVARGDPGFVGPLNRAQRPALAQPS